MMMACDEEWNWAHKNGGGGSALSSVAPTKTMQRYHVLSDTLFAVYKYGVCNNTEKNITDSIELNEKKKKIDEQKFFSQ